LFIYEMVKKKSCQNVCNPRVLSPAERELYGWVGSFHSVFRDNFRAPSRAPGCSVTV
ncbi:hypothetical protein PIB30_068616, partial [Stylosanthes scabra]|nr:hypothetical protein [Stylosanthes scabra]